MNLHVEKLMFRTLSLPVTLFVLVFSVAIHAEQPGPDEQPVAEDTIEAETLKTDMRKFVEMPEQARQVLREDMLDQFAVLNEIIEYLALNNYRAAADVAENGMGQSLRRRNQDREFGPARYMPEEMRRMGWNLHEAASNFALVARRQHPQATYGALQKITEACIACHYSYRTR
jgi:hypothetical protein